MEAIARFVNFTGSSCRLLLDARPPADSGPLAEVTNPKLIVAVGVAGLISNIVGLFLFHDHGGHSHGGGGHGHSHGGSSAKKAHGHSHDHEHDHEPAERTPLLQGSGSKGTPARSGSPAGGLSASSSTAVDAASDAGSALDEDESDAVTAEDELFVHPGELRANVLKKAHDAGYGATTGVSSAAHASGAARDLEGQLGGGAHDEHEGHGGHGGHGGSEGAMNMEGVFLHVLGDAVRQLLPWSEQWH